MDRYLITGYSGFVSRHFLGYLNSMESTAHILGIDVHPPEFDALEYRNLKCGFRKIDLMNTEELKKTIYDFQPNYVLHLASYSSVAFSWKSPVSSFSNNTNIFLNLVEQIRSLNLSCRILSVGSSEEYGKVMPSDIPITETQPVNPLSPYAVARVSQEMMSKVYVDGYGLDIVLTRSFNHMGPGQRDIFVISSFAKQLVDIRKNKKKPELITGNLEIIRDFLDVRDVVKAYHCLFTQGTKGATYNVCRGEGISLNDILKRMMDILEVTVNTKTDASLIRPNDNPIIIGSNQKLVNETGWAVTISMDQTLKDLLAWWEKTI